ncbi:hypothetical protein HELRODRAFT_162486 [Helobdella robusta]|uniref:Uncharacterized protein n=1 Tax=Helobdella robusta TaxID=6412 RepID=T1ESQ6_HELRO|nr:hypothetical protein HELRODRAFT_162486 [Helobdella robusta]ESN99009.1 hypothetical protein HELRODRAFT_162486 [Helobdella robusta]
MCVAFCCDFAAVVGMPLHETSVLTWATKPQCFRSIETTSGNSICIINGDISQPFPVSVMCEVECAHRCFSDPIECIGFNCRYDEPVASCEIVLSGGGDWVVRYVSCDALVTGCCRFYTLRKTWTIVPDVNANNSYDCTTTDPCGSLLEIGKKFPHPNPKLYVQCVGQGEILIKCKINACNNSSYYNVSISSCV